MAESKRSEEVITDEMYLMQSEKEMADAVKYFGHLLSSFYIDKMAGNNHRIKQFYFPLAGEKYTLTIGIEPIINIEHTEEEVPK
jgi:hypothetical protein